MPIQTKRIYAQAEPGDGDRVLIDRLWPRGVSKARAALTLWMKDIAPSTALREWFRHQPDRFEEFQAAYRQELDTDAAKREAVQALISRAKSGNVTLLYAAKDPRINHAAVLADYLRARL